MSISSSLQHITQILKNHPQARLESELLLSYVLQKSRSYLFAHAEQLLTSEQINQLHKLAQRRVTGEPIAYILEEKEFWSLSFKVTPDTLIPRPETELLVEKVLQLLPQHSVQTIADLGTGSGAIALAIASERPGWRIVAIDASEKALNIARENAVRLNIDSVNFLRSDWCEALPKMFYNAIVSNPPYIDETDKHLEEGDLRFEPRAALVAKENGLDALKSIILTAAKCLVKEGWLVLEHGYTQAICVREIMMKAGYHQVSSERDLSGHERLTLGRK